MKHVFLCGIAPLLAVSLLLFPGCKKEGKGKAEKRVRVTLGNLVKQKFQQKIPVKGTVDPVKHATLSAHADGTLDSLVEEGVHVKKGELLFSIERESLENTVKVKTEEVEIAKTELETAKIELKLAKTKEEKSLSDYNRAQSLSRVRAMSATDYEKEFVNLKAATALVEKCQVSLRYRQAQLVQAETNLKIAQKNLRDATITAPYDCLITEKLQEAGEYVKTGSNILKLEDVSQLEVVAYLNAVYHRKIKVGQTPAAISFDEEQFGTFKISYCAETIDPVTRTFKIKVLLPKDFPLKSGILCDLNVILAEAEGYGLPESAILQSGTKFHVYTATTESKAKSVEVKKGILDGSMCQILNPEALKGKKILVTGQRFVNDGDKLSIAE